MCLEKMTVWRKQQLEAEGCQSCLGLSELLRDERGKGRRSGRRPCSAFGVQVWLGAEG